MTRSRSLSFAVRLSALALVLTAGALWWSNLGHTAVAEGNSAVETNKEVLRRLYEAFNRGNFDAFNQLIAADVVDHNPTPGQSPGIEGVKEQFAIFKAGFPDIEVTIEQLLAEGDMVADRIVVRGTNTGSFLGLPPTGKQVQFEAIETYRVANGKIVEAWHVEDIFGLLIQLGVIPPLGQ